MSRTESHQSRTVLKIQRKNTLFRGLIICGVTNRQCPCEVKKGIYSYITCWKNNNSRIYIKEQELTRRISSILNRINLPNSVITELQQELKSAKVSERKFNSEEIKRLKTEQEKLKQKLDTLFDLRLDGELDRESFDIKRNDIQIKIERIKRRIFAHEKADNSFDETILGLLDIATQAGYVFEKSSNIELKRLLLKFVFEKITLTEGVISYKLRFPFNEFVNINTPKGNKPLPYEPTQNQVNQDVYGNDNEKVQFGYMKSCELAESLKNQGLAKISANPLQFGRGSKKPCYIFYNQLIYIYKFFKKRYFLMILCITLMTKLSYQKPLCQAAF